MIVTWFICIHERGPHKSRAIMGPRIHCLSSLTWVKASRAKGCSRLEASLPKFACLGESHKDQGLQWTQGFIIWVHLLRQRPQRLEATIGPYWFIVSKTLFIGRFLWQELLWQRQSYSSLIKLHKASNARHFKHEATLFVLDLRSGKNHAKGLWLSWMDLPSLV